MTSYRTDDTVGPWAKEKHDCLRKYLHAYSTILSTKNWCKGFYYVDAFAGRGRNLLRGAEKAEGDDRQEELFEVDPEPEELQQYIEGSARVALDVEPPFSAYLFIDNDPESLEKLANLEAAFADSRKISIQNGDANEVLRDQLVGNPKIDWRRSRAVVFLDPFGLQVPWDTLETLAETQAIEVLLNFPEGMAIQRNLHKTDLMNRYFGTNAWTDAVYEKRPTLFGDEKVEKKKGRDLALWYANRLKEIFGYSSRPRLITNSSGAHLYYLIFAGPNRTGAKIANDILKQGRRI